MTAKQIRSKTVTACLPLGLLGASCVILLASAGGLAAQDEGGLNVIFDVTQSFEGRDDEGYVETDGTSFRSLTTLAFGLSSETRSQRLAFDLSSGVAATAGDDRDVGFENTLATLDYMQSSRNTALTFGARYRFDEVDDLVFDGTLADDDIITGVGQREVLTLNTGLAFGREARVTGTLNHTYETSSFFDTLDPTLSDTETQELDARLDFELTRTLTAGVFALWREDDEQGLGATDREFNAIGTSASYAINPVTTLTGEISFSEEKSRGATFLETDGWNYGLSLIRERAGSDASLRFSQEDALTGTRRLLSAGQSLTLQRGALEYSLGITNTEGFDPQLLANLSFEYETARNSAASITLSQDGTINGDDEEVVNSRLNVTYAHNLTRVSQIDASFDLVDENVLGASAADQRAIQFNLTYNYDLAQDWQLTSGYEHSLIRRDGDPDRSRSTVFVGLQKSFAERL